MTRERPSHHAHESYQTPYSFSACAGGGGLSFPKPETESEVGVLFAHRGMGYPSSKSSPKSVDPPATKNQRFLNFFVDRIF